MRYQLLSPLTMTRFCESGYGHGRSHQQNFQDQHIISVYQPYVLTMTRSRQYYRRLSTKSDQAYRQLHHLRIVLRLLQGHHHPAAPTLSCPRGPTPGSDPLGGEWLRPRAKLSAIFPRSTIYQHLSTIRYDIVTTTNISQGVPQESALAQALHASSAPKVKSVASSPLRLSFWRLYFSWSSACRLVVLVSFGHLWVISSSPCPCVV
jgi:hypothetical protein